MTGRKAFTDMMGRKVEIPFPPRRIVSVVPSQTELLFDLGLDHEVIGITRFCVHPVQWFMSKKRIGGTKKLHLDEIIALKPDLVIANKEENTRADIELLEQHCPVWISAIHTVTESLDMIIQVGDLVDRRGAAEALVARIAQSLDTLPNPVQPIRAAYFIWKDPWMTVGRDTFIHDVMRYAGWYNVYGAQRRYPETSLEALKALNPGIVLLSSEPYPFGEIHATELKDLLPDATVLLVDGELFSWYGSRLQYTAAYLSSLGPFF